MSNNIKYCLRIDFTGKIIDFGVYSNSFFCPKTHLLSERTELHSGETQLVKRFYMMLPGLKNQSGHWIRRYNYLLFLSLLTFMSDMFALARTQTENKTRVHMTLDLKALGLNVERLTCST